MMWEMDYPHSDSTWPNAAEQVWGALSKANVPDAEINRITHENAMQCFSFDPFKYRPKQKATVAALRAEATDVDTSIKSMGRRKAEAGASALSAQLASVASKGAAEAG
jgi:hypothetical protein